MGSPLRQRDCPQAAKGTSSIASAMESWIGGCQERDLSHPLAADDDHGCKGPRRHGDHIAPGTLQRTYQPTYILSDSFVTYLFLIMFLGSYA